MNIYTYFRKDIWETGCLLVELSNWKLSLRGTLFTVGPLLLKFMEILPIWKEMLIDTRYSKEVRFSIRGYWWEGAAQRGEEWSKAVEESQVPQAWGGESAHRLCCQPQHSLRATFQSAGAFTVLGANPQEQALWDGLVALSHREVIYHCQYGFGVLDLPCAI